MAHAFDYPLRFALASDTVDKDDIPNAVALSTIAIDLTGIVGPAVAGMLIPVIGEGGVFWVVAGSYTFDMWAFYMIRVTPKVEIEKVAEQSVVHNLIEGARYIRSNHPIFAVLMIGVIYNLVIYPMQSTLMPLFAASVLGVGVRGYGFLLAALGVGALIGAAVIASLGNFRYKAWLLVVTAVAAGSQESSLAYQVYIPFLW